jgi:hypothetical protein
MADEEAPRHSGSIVVARPPEEVYALVSDVTRMGEWSPVCTACWWDEGASPTEGAWFTGRNETPERTWETRCRVAAADPGEEFTFVVMADDEPMTRWSYTFAPTADGTELTETWEPQPGILARFAAIPDGGGAAALQVRVDAAHSGIPATLGAIKAAAEAS